ncbi:MAG: adenine deaminase [Bacteroidales bacterium]|nr:adenine deaminase [Bacteroidales bacterium]
MKEKKYLLFGKLVDPVNKKILDACISVENEKIVKIEPARKKCEKYILPGFIDSHVHIESSMLTPGEFARLAVRHGTIATMSDPHEIANVCGEEGLKYMIEDGKKVPLKFHFGVPSCVPATDFETSGATLNADKVKKLLKREDYFFLSEMMNYPGVIHDDAEVWRKIKSAIKLNKPIDGHAPGIKGEDLKKYAGANITTDHESATIDEAIEKIKNGIKIQIREGSAAKNFNALYPLITKHPEKVMLCTDDCHPDDLVKGHINLLVKRGLKKGIDLFDLMTVACVNPVRHYNLNIGLLQTGDPADFIIVDDLENLNVLETYINGEKVYGNGKILFKYKAGKPVNNFKREEIAGNDLLVKDKGGNIRIIKCFDGQLFTSSIVVRPNTGNGQIISDIKKDYLKLVVVNRYNNSKPAIGFIHGIGFKDGAVAQSIAHDSHNVIAVGTNDEDLLRVINKVISLKGGIAISEKGNIHQLPLEIAGLMSSESGEKIAAGYAALNELAKSLGSSFKSPLMTLSFMALLVIPELKLSDKGLFDVNAFSHVSLFVE